MAQTKNKLITLSLPAIEKISTEAKKQRLFCKTYIELLLEKMAETNKFPKV